MRTLPLLMAKRWPGLRWSDIIERDLTAIVTPDTGGMC
jgi:hypothetical protein